MGIQQTGNCGKKNIACFFISSALILLFFVTGCQKTNITFGSQFLDNNYSQLVRIDTVATQLDTRFYDSIQTSGSGKGLVGFYNDAQFGAVTASTYCKLAPPAYALDTDYTKSTFDSLVIFIKPDGHYYGDTLTPVHLDAYRLSAPLQPPPDRFGYSTSYYNFDAIAQYPTSLGGTDFLYYPHNPNSDSIRIKLSQSIGLELFSLMQQKDLSIQNVTNFQNYFFGLCISPGTNPGLVLSFNDSIHVRMYYNEPGVITVSTFKDFVFNDGGNQFNNISINRKGTPLATVTPDVYNLVNSSKTGNKAYLQSTTGTGVKVSFPNLRGLLQIPNYIMLTRATLVLKPVLGTYDPIFTLPDSLRLTETDTYGDLLGDISVSTGSSSTALIGLLNVDYLYGQNTQYTFNITSYINTQLATSANNGNGLIVSPPVPFFSTRFDRAVFDNSNNPIVNTQLLVYYITVQQP